MNPQLGTLEVNPSTGEPFLRLQTHKDIIITPPRWDDGPQFIPYMNDPLVYQWIQGAPFPYMPDDAQYWLHYAKPGSDAVLDELERARDEPKLIFVGHCPVSIIRKVNEDGSDVFIGVVELSRSGFGEIIKVPKANPSEGHEYLMDMGKKEENDKVNNERAAGDPGSSWDFGDYLAPAHHGRGIMTDAINTIINKWAIPRMNARTILASTFAGNIGSQRVFEKNGFKHVMTLKDHIEVRGSRKTLELFEWTL